MDYLDSIGEEFKLAEDAFDDLPSGRDLNADPIPHIKSAERALDRYRKSLRPLPEEFKNA